ncbi:choice-of-anchor I family protein [Polaribacter sargassicola]|uniref:choice-of-anchor I family protein n=1 Tax=Polaribacter sargassicola TaxID=2836891 RepID=UPI001F40CDD7|nr:choice-of-anchor I family protein [Polaribacter sp. DS7-9]MCG1037213.1 choice-of-anchor I family protein [Polaribacter sp. DS7-9]
MKKTLLLIYFTLFTFILSAQITTGDMAFIAFNADADDDFAMVTFVEIPANTTIYFTDSEWNGTSFGDDENDFSWNSGNDVIAAGTVITFNTISADVPSVSIGTITGEPGGASATSEAIFAFLGTAPRTPTTFIAAVANSSSAYGDLTGTGLVDGSTAITYPSSTDIAQYNGVKTGLDANGYLAALNNMDNYNLQSGSGDQSADGIVPDLPFNTTAFVISTNDLSAPSVSNAIVTSQNTIQVTFSEEITQASAENIANYILDNGLTISEINYDNATKTSTITHSGFTVGTAYTITVNNSVDLANNTQETTFVSDTLFYNNTTSGLIITEIMYNAPSDDSDALEFLEIYNNSDSSIELGGIQVLDEGDFTFTFPQQTLASKEIVLLATDKTTADAFYGVTFLDMPQEISNALGNGGELIKIINSDATSIFEVEYDDKDNGWTTAADGDGPSIELLNPDADVNDGNNWVASTNLVGQSLGDNVYASPGIYTPITTVTPNLGFKNTVYNVSEENDSVTITLETSSITTSDVTVDVNLISSLLTATEGSDFTFTNQTATITAGSTSTEITITISNDSDAEADEMFILELVNPTNAVLDDNTNAAVYILDNDTAIPTATNELGISFLTSYLVDASGSAEISAYAEDVKRLYVLNSIAKKINILDFSNPNAISEISSIDLSSYGTEGPTSVATFGDFVVAAVSNGPEADGVVVFMDKNGNNISSVTVGNLPDNASFTPDGTKVVVANEGQPNSDYSIDPEGSISIIDVTAGFGNVTQSDVININFNAFDADIDAMRASNIRIFGPGSSVSQDLEPEYITYSEDSKTAWVSLQENNAIAEIDLTNNTITSVFPLGLKDHTLPNNTIDTSNDTDFIFHANWPIKGMFMPDAIASYTVNGTTYIVTANEGDAREYDALEEEVSVGDSDYELDPTVFPNAAYLKLDSNLGKLSITNQSGDIDNDGDFDEIHVFGGRSFSIFNATTQTLVYDSGDDFERITANDPTYASLFNASNSNNTLKNRSDNKGPEPEGVTIATINNKVYAFITLERVGGFMTYDITDPTNPVFEKYINNRTLGDDEGGDLGPEGIIYISADKSPTEKGLVVLSNEVSATISVYSLDNVLDTDDFSTVKKTISMYPNPVKANQTVFFNEKINAILFDIRGRKILEKSDVKSLQIPNLSKGTYIFKINNSISKKVVIE